MNGYDQLPKTNQTTPMPPIKPPRVDKSFLEKKIESKAKRAIDKELTIMRNFLSDNPILRGLDIKIEGKDIRLSYLFHNDSKSLLERNSNIKEVLERFADSKLEEETGNFLAKLETLKEFLETNGD